jgi:hypothetical protein
MQAISPRFRRSNPPMPCGTRNLSKEIDPKRSLFKLEVIPQNPRPGMRARRGNGRGAAQKVRFAVNAMLETLTLICPHPRIGCPISMATAPAFSEDSDPQLAGCRPADQSLASSR